MRRQNLLVVLLTNSFFCFDWLGLAYDGWMLYLPSDGAPIHYGRITRLSLGPGAPNVLTRPIKFRHLVEVGLESSSSNAENLRLLDLNYPRILSLSVDQDSILSDDSVQLLKKFTRLRKIGLDCPLQSPELICSSLPTSVDDLYLGANSNIPDRLKWLLYLPNVRSMDIRCCVCVFA